MKNFSQSELLRERLEIQQSIRLMSLGRSRWQYLKNFLDKHQKIISLALICLFFQALIEIIILILVEKSIGVIHLPNSLISIYWLAGLIVGSCILYTILALLAVRYERKSVLALINDLRKKLFSNNLSFTSAENNYQIKTNLLAKISYHLSLLSLGIDNTLISSIRFLLYAVVIAIYCLVFNKILLVYLIGVILFCGLLFLLSFFLSKFYLTRQVASYSRLIQHIAIALFEFTGLKKLHREELTIKKLERIVEIDTQFRVTRDSWVRYSGRVVFVLVTALGALYFLTSSVFPNFSLEGVNFINRGIFYIYAIRMLYLSTRIGLYFLPLRLGMVLSIPEHSIRKIVSRPNWDWNVIEFKSNKTKLFFEGEYLKNISLTFNIGKRYLFIGKSLCGKSSLVSLLAGEGIFSRHSWLIKIDEERLNYNAWAELFKDSYLFSSNFTSELSLAEIILNKDKIEINADDIMTIYQLQEKFPVFEGILSKKRFIGESAKQFSNSPSSLFAIQVAHCLVNKPKFVLIDNALIDLGYSEIADLIKLMERELKGAVIIVFSRARNNIISYDETYEINSNNIEKI